MVEQIPREENVIFDATSRDTDVLIIIPFEVLGQPTISESKDVTLLDEKVTWMNPIL